MTRYEVQAVIDEMKSAAKTYADACSSAAERCDYDGVNSNADKASTMRRAARMLTEALEKSAATPVECAVCNWVDCNCPKMSP